MVIIQPFAYQMSTAFKERVDLADKLNELINLLNAWGDVPEQFEQVQEQIQTIGQQINDITTKISTIETNLGQLQTTVTNLGAKLNHAAIASTLSTSDHIDSEKVGIAIDSIDGTTNKVSYLVGATAENAGLMTAADKEKLDDAITEIPIASTTRLGGIKVGANLQITADGTLNASGGGGEPTVTLPAHIIGANDENSLVSVSPVRQNGNLLIRTTYKDYTTAGTTAKNVDGGLFPIASTEDSGLMAAIDKQTLNDVKETTDAMSTTIDTIQSDLDSLEQNFQDLKGDLLTSPAEVVQIADDTHDGIITKEKFAEIGQPIVEIEKVGFGFLDDLTINLSSSIDLNAYDSHTSFNPPVYINGIGIDNQNSIKGFQGSFKDRGTTDDIYYKADISINAIFSKSGTVYLFQQLSSTPTEIHIMCQDNDGDWIEIRPNDISWTKHSEYDKNVNGITYYCFSFDIPSNSTLSCQRIGCNSRKNVNGPLTVKGITPGNYLRDRYSSFDPNKTMISLDNFQIAIQSQ